MSYILDALKKAEEGRNRGKAPALFSVQVADAPLVEKSYWPWVFGAALMLICAVLLVNWPYKNKPSAPKTLAMANASQSEASIKVVPIAEQTVVSPPLPPVNSPSVADARNGPESKSLVEKEKATRAPSAASKISAVTVEEKRESAKINDTGEHEVPTRIQLPSELPSGVRQELPALVVNMHMYSSKPTNRLASVNNKPLREGDELSPGLKLVEIMPDGLMFSYKGHRFKKGIN